jgi:uncharacterized protein with PIN domain
LKKSIIRVGYDEKKSYTSQKCECGEMIEHVYREKRMDGGFPLSVRVSHECSGCGAVYWNYDYTKLAKEDYQSYLHESNDEIKNALKRLNGDWKRLWRA